MKLPTVDIFIPSAGRNTLIGYYDAWVAYINGNSNKFRGRVWVIQDGNFDLHSRAKVFTRASRSRNSGQPGLLVHTAIQQSKADYVVHGFDDDPPANIGPLVERLVQTGADWCSSSVSEIRNDFKPVTIYDGIPSDALLNRNTVPLQGCVFRRSVFKKVPFVEPDTPFWCYDHEIVLRLHLNQTVNTYVVGVHGFWFINPTGITSSLIDRGHTLVWQDRRSDLWKKYRG